MAKEVWKPIPATSKGLTFEDIGVDRKVFEEPVAPAEKFSFVHQGLSPLQVSASYPELFPQIGGADPLYKYSVVRNEATGEVLVLAHSPLTFMRGKLIFWGKAGVRNSWRAPGEMDKSDITELEEMLKEL